MPPPPPIPPITIRLTNPPFGAGSAVDCGRPHRCSQSTLAGRVRQVVHAAADGGPEHRVDGQVGRGRLATPSPPRLPSDVGLVEEHDDAAVAQRELAQLAEQRLHLHDADAHEHGLEGARVDEHVGRPVSPATASAMSVLPVPGGPHSRMPPGTWPPLLSISSGSLEEDDVLLDPLEHVVLAPHVGEAGLDLGRHVGLDAALRHEPEDGDELQDGQPDEEHDVEQRRHALHRPEGQVPQPARGLDQRRAAATRPRGRRGCTQR